MKTKLKILGVLMLLIASAFTASAYDFEVDGIYYNKTSDTEVAVTYRNSNYKSYSGRVTIPASVTYSGTTYAVTSIGENAFYNCSGLTSVTIPNSVTEIGFGAFTWCRGLTSVTIPNSVTSIGNSAFYGCSGLTSVTIPNSVTEIGNFAFYNCSGLTSVTIPNSVTEIGDYAFENCSRLKSVHITDLAAWCKIDFYNWDSNPLYYAHNLYLNGEKVTNLVIPNSVTKIGSYAFYGCSGLTSVTIPNSLTSIGRDCFPANTELLYEDGSSAVIDGALYNKDKTALLRLIDKSLNTFVILKSVKTIGAYAFYDCSSLTSIFMPNSVTSIGEGAFYGCSGLTSVTIPNSVTSIGENAFYNCSGLTSVTIPNSVTEIGDWAFYNCSGLTSVTIPNSVASIGYEAFSGCRGLTAVHITDLAAWCKIEFGNYAANPLLYAHNLYLNGEKVTNLVIPNSVTKIGDYAFYECRGLTSVNIPNSVTSIGEDAFWGCSGLTSVTIPNSVTEIGDWAFYKCSGLTSVTIPNSVTSIGNYAFCLCSGLTSVTIPNSVTSIGNRAFYGCSGLTSVTIPNSVTSIGDYAFYGCSGLTSVTIPNSVTSIGDYAFYGCSGLTSVTVPNSVESIDESVFSDCTALSKVSFADGNTALSIIYSRFGQAFANCPLSEVYIGRNLNFDSSPFSGKTTLKTVTIGNSVSTIGERAFYDCSGLESLTIGRNTSEIGDYTFSGCKNLSTIYSYAGTPPTIYEHTFENLTYAKANLYVPKGCVSIYEADPLWYPFYNILEGDYNGVDDVIADEASGEIVGYYNLQGVRSDDPWDGLNIVVYSDGTRRKIKY